MSPLETQLLADTAGPPPPRTPLAPAVGEVHWQPPGSAAGHAGRRTGSWVTREAHCSQGPAQVANGAAPRLHPPARACSPAALGARIRGASIQRRRRRARRHRGQGEDRPGTASAPPHGPCTPSAQSLPPPCAPAHSAAARCLAELRGAPVRCGVRHRRAAPFAAGPPLRLGTAPAGSLACVLSTPACGESHRRGETAPERGRNNVVSSHGDGVTVVLHSSPSRPGPQTGTRLATLRRWRSTVALWLTASAAACFARVTTPAWASVPP